MILSECKEFTSDACLENLYHHFKVLAGPGAGKTHWLANHIRNVLRNSDRITPVTKVACISYTTVAAEELKARLQESGDRVEVSTIHGFLYRNIVKPYLWLLRDETGGYEVNFADLAGHIEHRPSQGKLVAWIKQHPKLRYLWGNTRGALEGLSGLCWNLEGGQCRLRIRKNHVRAGRRHDGRKLYPLPNIQDLLKSYKKLYWQDGEIHHEDVLYFAFRILDENPVLRSFLSSRYPYVLLDEFQDTNPIQTQIVKWLAAAGSIVGVIGDPCQSIYKFQGASPEDFVDFCLPGMITYRISGNRRSTQHIIDLLNYMRRGDIVQTCVRKEVGCPVRLFTGGNVRQAIHCAGDHIKTDSSNAPGLVILGRQTETVARVRAESAETGGVAWSKLRDADSDREQFLYHIVAAWKYADQARYDQAIRELSTVFRRSNGQLRSPLTGSLVPGTQERSIVLRILQYLVDNRRELLERTVLDLNNTDLPRLLSPFGVRLQKITRGEVESVAKHISCKELVQSITVREDTSAVRTIHSAKGAEFPAVTVWFEKEKDFDYVLDPKLNDRENEESRVYYVAASRARDVLYMYVPALSPERKTRAELLGLSVMGVTGSALTLRGDHVSHVGSDSAAAARGRHGI